MPYSWVPFIEWPSVNSKIIDEKKRRAVSMRHVLHMRLVCTKYCGEILMG